VDAVLLTINFLIEGATSAIVIASDTGPTEEIWDRANRLANLKAVFLEATFPDALGWLAEAAKHFTPSSFAREARKLHGQPAVFAVHIKARYHEQVVAELRALGLPNLEIAQAGQPYVF